MSKNKPLTNEVYIMPMAENEVLIFLAHMIFFLLCSDFSQLSFYDRKKQLVFLLMPLISI